MTATALFRFIKSNAYNYIIKVKSSIIYIGLEFEPFVWYYFSYRYFPMKDQIKMRINSRATIKFIGRKNANGHIIQSIKQGFKIERSVKEWTLSKICIERALRKKGYELSIYDCYSIIEKEFGKRFLIVIGQKKIVDLMFKMYVHINPEPSDPLRDDIKDFVLENLNLIE